MSPSPGSGRGQELAVAVVGLRFGANHARIFYELPGVRLAAICDTDEQRLADAAKGRDVHTYSDYRTMLCDEKLDAIVVAVPARLHEPVALAAIEAGCALLVEKPLAPTLEEGHRLVTAASAARVTLMPGHLERFNPAVQELARRMRAGEIGRVLHMAARRMGPIVVRNQDVNIVHDTALHDVDAMRYILGADVERVFAAGRSDLNMPFEDSISALLRFSPPSEQVYTPLDLGEFGRGLQSVAFRSGPGVTASIDANWLAPVRIRDLTIRGTEGMFVLDYAAQSLDLYAGGPSAEIPNTSGGAPQRIEIKKDEPLMQELAAFVAAVRGEARLAVTPEDALAALAVCDAITESARTGRAVIPQPAR